MTIHRAPDPDISYASADSMTLWCYSIVAWRIDTRNKKFILTPIMRDGGGGPSIDATDMRGRFAHGQSGRSAAER